MKKRLIVLIVLLGAVASACAAGTGRYDLADPAGFLSGIWHGWIAPITLIWQIFDADVRIYEPVNTGWWYDAGFYFAVISGFGSLSLRRRKPKPAKPAKSKPA
ncbi:MAG: hypothetical protein KJO18_03145 [Acidimicrobiia bacterium]|nr:hypothetical protein [Acidimicrobiia bacterium]